MPGVPDKPSARLTWEQGPIRALASPPPAGGAQSTYFWLISGYKLTLVEASMFMSTGWF